MTPVLPPDATRDEAHMHLALTLAEGAIGLSDPNPRVGCVIVGRHGEVLAQGHTQHAGGPHAEVVALQRALETGAPLEGASVYVTLEPCAHHGRTPPCCDALVAARVGRVVAATQDPNPLVAGQGLARLRAAGIAVQTGVLEDAAREINIGFFSRMVRQRPWVRVKMASSLDGRTALADGRSQWITGAAARGDGHAWRRRAGAVLTGIGTVRDDDPRLDVRLVATARQPLRVVVDATLAISAAARVLQPPGRVLIVTAQPGAATAPPGTDAEVISLPGASARRVDLPAMLIELARRGINELHVEAGAGLTGAFVQAGLVDELLLYVAPVLLGPGRELAHLAPLAGLDDALRFEWHDITRIGPDLRLRARPAGRLAGWLPHAAAGAP